MTSIEIVSDSVPTEDGKGRLYRMEQGKRIVLGQWDQWQHNNDEPLLDQCARVSFSPEEQARRRQGAQRLGESFSRAPFYAEAAQKSGDEDKYWEGFYASRVNW